MKKAQWMSRYLQTSLFVLALWPTILSAQSEDKNGIASSYNNIGTLLYSQDKLDEALGYYLKTVQIEEGTINLFYYRKDF